MTENIKNNLIRTGLAIVAGVGIFVGLTACDTSDPCDNPQYNTEHYYDCNHGGAISPYGYGINY